MSESNGQASFAEAVNGPEVLAVGQAPTRKRSDSRSWLPWAEGQLPDQYAPYAATAAAMLVYAGWPVTIAAVRARLARVEWRRAA
jgi:hypothetical protein